MSSPLTVGERIILHLAQFSKYQDEYDVPFDVSQDGIASALRISRAHAAIELKKLRDGDDIVERLAHIRKGRNRRKVYFLTMRGVDKARRIRDFAEKEGIDVRPLLDIRQCEGRELWESLGTDLRPVLARASVFRKPFNRKALPPTSVTLLPENKMGMVEMPEDLKKSLICLIGEDELRGCHSFAADYWLDQGDYRERLYHLSLAGRSREAEMLISMNGQEMVKQSDEDLYGISLILPEPSIRYVSKVNRFRTEVALWSGHGEECLKLIEVLFDPEDISDRVFTLSVRGRLLIQRGDAEGALVHLYEARALSQGKDVALDCTISRALLDAGRLEEAKALLEGLLPETARSTNGTKLPEIQFLLGLTNLRLGEPVDAVKYLSKGMGMVRKEDRGEWYSALSDAYMALGMREKAEEYQSMVPRSRKWSSASAYPGR